MARLSKIPMARWARGWRRFSTPVSVLAVAVAAVTTVALTGAFTGAFAGGSGATGLTLNRQQIAQRILRTQASKVMTAPALAALHMLATGSKELSPGLGRDRATRAGGIRARKRRCGAGEVCVY